MNNLFSKLIITISFVFIYSSFSFSQPKFNRQSLEKYSYLVYGKITTYDPHRYGINNGTGFFLRKGNKLFFITAYHVLHAWDPNSFHSQISEGMHWPEKMYIRVQRKDNNQRDSIEIDLSKHNKENDQFHGFEKPDICKIEIKNYSQYNIFSVEEYIDPKSFYLEPISITSYGYAGSHRDIKPSNTSLKLYSSLDNALVTNSDTIAFNYIVTFTGKAGPGYSGAPVFFQSIIQDSLKSTFGGIVIAGGGITGKKRKNFNSY